MYKLFFQLEAEVYFNVRKAKGSLILFTHILLPNKLKESKGSKVKKLFFNTIMVYVKFLTGGVLFSVKMK